MNHHSEQKIKLLFGTHIRALRKERGLSQEEFASLCGMDRTYIGGIERGERNVSLVNIFKIAKELKIPLSELFEFDNGK